LGKKERRGLLHCLWRKRKEREHVPPTPLRRGRGRANAPPNVREKGGAKPRGEGERGRETRYLSSPLKDKPAASAQRRTQQRMMRKRRKGEKRGVL